MQRSTVVAALLTAVVVAGVSPYLARLTLSVPDRRDALWWRARRIPSTSRSVVVAAVGLGCGGLAGASGERVGSGFELAALVWLGFLWLGLVVTPLVVIDVEHHRLPDRLVLTGLVGGTVFLGGAALVDGDDAVLVRAGVAAVVVFALFCVLTLSTGFGFGDTKLLAVLAGYLGWLGWGYVLCGVIAGFAVGALVSVLLLLSRRVRWDTAVPFGPALIVGALLVTAFGLVPAGLP